MKKLYAFFIGLVVCNYVQGSSENLNMQQKQECRVLFRREIQAGIPTFKSELNYDAQMVRADNRQKLCKLTNPLYNLVTLISRLKFSDCPSSFTGNYRMFFLKEEQDAIQENYHILRSLESVASDKELSSFVDTNAEQYYKNKKIVDNAEATHQDAIKALACQW